MKNKPLRWYWHVQRINQDRLSKKKHSIGHHKEEDEEENLGGAGEEELMWRCREQAWKTEHGGIGRPTTL